MKRQEKFKCDLIITADWHLMDRQPICRTDDFWTAQWDKVDQILDLLVKYQVPVYHAGDLFDHWKTSPYLINSTLNYMQMFSPHFFTIIGNHDMPSHNIDNMDRSGLQTLFKSGTVNQILFQGDWGVDYKKVKPIYYKHTSKKIVMLHIMTYKGTKPWPGCTDPECHELFGWFPKADLIITGHNHKTFTARKGKQLLVNPGSLTRHKADQINHRPCVFLYDSKKHKLKKHYLKINKNVVSREHVDTQKRKKARFAAFISKLSQDWDLGLSFEDNIINALSTENIDKEVEQIVYEWMGR